MTGTVQRFTTEYVADQDRLRMSFEFEDGSVQVLWLTRRLLDRLITRLLQYVDQDPLPGGDAQNPVKAKAQQRFNQEAALAALSRQEPVRVTRPQEQKARPTALVSHVELRRRDRVLEMDLRSGETVLLTLPFHKAELRQWLGVLHKKYQQAEWNGAFWPDWIEPGDAAAEANASRVN